MAGTALPVLVLILSAWLGFPLLSPAWDCHSSNFTGFVFLFPSPPIHLVTRSSASQSVLSGCFPLCAFTSCLFFGANLAPESCVETQVSLELCNKPATPSLSWLFFPCKKSMLCDDGTRCSWSWSLPSYSF